MREMQISDFFSNSTKATWASSEKCNMHNFHLICSSVCCYIVQLQNENYWVLWLSRQHIIIVVYSKRFYRFWMEINFCVKNIKTKPAQTISVTFINLNIITVKGMGWSSLCARCQCGIMKGLFVIKKAFRKPWFSHFTFMQYWC